jgi:hypothetical protein
MEFLHDEIETEYRRWLKKIGDQDPYASRDTIGLQDILRAHFLIVDFFLENKYGIGGIGPKSVDLLHSAIYRQFVGFGSVEKWPGQYERLTTLLFGLVKDHLFHDGKDCRISRHRHHYLVQDFSPTRRPPKRSNLHRRALRVALKASALAL